MKPFPRLFILAACLAPALALAAETKADSRISAVTVYPDRAVVTRTATVSLPAGATELRFDQLPASLNDRSLEVAARGTAEATILDVNARSTFVDYTPNERVKALEDELKNVGHQQRALQDRAKILEDQRGYILKIQNASTAPSREANAPRPTLEEWTRLLAFSQEQLAKIATERQSVDDEAEGLRLKQEALEHQLAELRNAGSRSYKSAIVRLNAATAGELSVTLRYAVPGASWTATYDARVSTNDNKVQLSYSAEVRQNTGEEWKDVALTLSTARPSLGGQPPALIPWSVDVRPQYAPMPVAAAAPSARMKTVNAASEAYMAAGTIMDAAKIDRDVEAEAARAAVTSQATSAVFTVAVPSSVGSDNSPQKVPVTRLTLASTSEYVAIPKRRAAAFLSAKATNTSEFPLLAGPMNVFLDGTFIATSRLDTIMPGEALTLALGVDEGIAVKHKLVRRFTEDAGIVSKSQRVTYHYVITLQNNKTTPVALSVFDQVPVSRNEKIVVRLIAPSERELKPAEDGALNWKLTLKPGEKREIPVNFSIEWPNDLPVTGVE